MQKQNSTIVLLCIHLSVCKNKSTYKTVNLLSDSDCERSESLNFKAGKKFWRYISSRRKDTINVSLMTNPSLQERTPPPSLLWCQPFSRLPGSINITKYVIEKLLEQLNPKKACGPDLISCHVLKEAFSQIAPYLWCIFFLEPLIWSGPTGLAERPQAFVKQRNTFCVRPS